MRKKYLSLLWVGLFLFASNAKAEYRAYLVEVYDHILQKKWDAASGFDPQQYVATHGGGNRLSVLLKATWNCYGDTGQFRPACPMPEPKDPKFKVGDRVKIALEKHLTFGWKGTVEIALWRQDLKSNVYGVRFGERKQMYGRYFEFNLEPLADASGDINGEKVPEPTQ